jgi:uncharacterized repeat protein (TIGR03843 family)
MGDGPDREDDRAIAAALLHGDVEVLGRMPWSSNGTYLCDVRCGDDVRRAVYKPRQGERPLWDFPSGLDQREVAAYELSRGLGWDLVPVTVRREGPFGLGSLQEFIDADFEQHYFTLYEDEANHPRLMAMCAFDFVGNNTDRKSGHCLLGLDGRIRGIDHGLMFHHEFKLRTVIWEFGGGAIPDDLVADLTKLVEDGLPDDLACLLDTFERDAVLTRARAMADAGYFPIDESGRRYPWPLV